MHALSLAAVRGQAAAIGRTRVPTVAAAASVTTGMGRVKVVERTAARRCHHHNVPHCYESPHLHEPPPEHSLLRTHRATAIRDRSLRAHVDGE